MITGVWKGKIGSQKVEVKIIQQGDSLRGTSYYYESPSNYRRYAIKGYFKSDSNEAVWWDDELIAEKPNRATGPGKNPLLNSADFNCPGSGKMTLDGKSVTRQTQRNNPLHLEKAGGPSFEDEWDFVIDNYTSGANDPYIIDSIGNIAFSMPVSPSPVIVQPAVAAPVVVKPTPEPTRKSEPAIIVQKPQTIEEKFVSRKKILTTEIPVSGDSIELRFYDNAEIDGDSISLFLNEKLIFRHIRLTGSAYTIKLAVSELHESNELIMVAENLGSIPPNTSYMVVLVGDHRYEARLESTEGSSAMVRFVKKPG